MVKQMKNKYTHIAASAGKFILACTVIVAPLILTGCNEKDNVTDPWSTYGGPVDVSATPVIENVSPAGKALAGIDEITITGKNFSPVVSENYVNFGPARAEVVSATATQLVVKAPNYVSDSLEIKISRHNALMFSNKYSYKLSSAYSVFKDFAAIDVPYALTTDKDGNFYFSFVQSGSKQGVKMITPDGAGPADFAPAGGETFFYNLKYAGNNTFYGVRNVKAIFEIKQGVASKTFVSTGLGTIQDIDFDQNGFIWAVGPNKQIYRVNKNDKTVKAFDLEADLRTVRYHNGYLYVAGKRSSKEVILKAQINGANEIASVEEYSDFTTAGIQGLIKQINIAQDGTIYAGMEISGTTPVDPLVIVNNGTPKVLYPGIIFPNIDQMDAKYQAKFNSFAWVGDYLYVIRHEINTDNKKVTPAILKVWIGKNPAPYFGA